MFGNPVQASPQEIVTTLAWLLAITVSATLYYHSRNLSQVLLYSGVAFSVCIVILVTGQPPLPAAIYKVFSMLGIPSAALLLLIFAVIIGREVVLRNRKRTAHSRPAGQRKKSSSFTARGHYAYGYSGNVVKVLYHGTPAVENARDILNYGFLIGPRNSYGSGLYLADLPSATGYAQGEGMIIKVKLDIPTSQIVDYQSVVSSIGFKSWASDHGSGNQGDDLADYTINVLRRRFLKVDPDFYVGLAQRTNGNERVIFEGVSILGLLDAFGNPIYRR